MTLARTDAKRKVPLRAMCFTQKWGYGRLFICEEYAEAVLHEEKDLSA
jgi:hypothetical protein